MRECVSTSTQTIYSHTRWTLIKRAHGYSSRLRSRFTWNWIWIFHPERHMCWRSVESSESNMNCSNRFACSGRGVEARKWESLWTGRIAVRRDRERDNDKEGERQRQSGGEKETHAKAFVLLHIIIASYWKSEISLYFWCWLIISSSTNTTTMSAEKVHTHARARVRTQSIASISRSFSRKQLSIMTWLLYFLSFVVCVTCTDSQHLKV